MARELKQTIRIEAIDAATSTVSKARESFLGLDESIAGIAAPAAAAAAGIALVKTALIDSFQAALDQEEVTARLVAALSNLRPGAEAGAAALLAQADGLQKLTRYSDDAVISAQALLATFGVAPEKLEQATQVTVDLAAALGVDLETAARQVGSTFSGVTRGLDKLVPGLKDLSEESLKSGAALDLLAQRLEGRAAAAAETMAGRLDQLKNALGEVQETIGNSAVQSDRLANGLSFVTRAVELWNSALKTALPLVGELLLKSSTLVTTYDALSTIWTSAAEALGLSNQATTAAVVTNDALVRSVTKLAEIQDRETRILSENATARSRAVAIARELGVTLESEVNQKLEREAELWRELNGILGETGDQVAASTVAQTALAEAVESSAAASDSLSLASRSLRTELQLAAAQAVFTSQAFDQLARSQGRGVAVEAAVAAGGELILGGTRVNLPGGGSRLTHAPGLNGGRFYSAGNPGGFTGA